MPPAHSMSLEPQGWTSSETAEIVGLKAERTKKRQQIQNFWKTEICIWDKNIYKEQPYINKQ